MLLDMTFRFDVPQEQFEKLQQILADSANQVDHENQLVCNVAVPVSDVPHRSYTLAGALVGLKESF